MLIGLSTVGKKSGANWRWLVISRMSVQGPCCDRRGFQLVFTTKLETIVEEVPDKTETYVETTLLRSRYQLAE